MLVVGLAVDGPRVSGWTAALAEAVAGLECVDLTVFIHPMLSATAADPGDGRLAAAFFRADRLAQRLLYRRSPSPDDLVDLPERGFDVYTEAPADVDILIAAGGEPAAGALLLAAGGIPVWWLDHDGAASGRAGRSGYAEAVRGEHLTSCRLLEADRTMREARTLLAAHVATVPLCAAENRQQLLWKSIPLVVRALREHTAIGAGPQGRAESGPLAGVPLPRSSIALAGVLAGHACRAAAFVGRRLLWREHWSVAVVTPSHSGEPASTTVRILEPPGDRYWADPHPLPGDSLSVLVEEYPAATRRGRIVLLEVGAADRATRVRPVLEADAHLSYPYLFTFEDALYMAPESGELGRLDLYRCGGSTDRWDLVARLLDGVRLIDASLFPWGGLWWMFATVQDEEWLAPRDNLYLFMAEDPVRGPWTAHPANPVVCDARSARPAGSPFVRAGRLYRPGQDCAPRYGYGIRLHEVEELTPTRYREREVAFIPPPGGPYVATHTYSLRGDTVFVDVMRWVPRWGMRGSASRQGTGSGG